MPTTTYRIDVTPHPQAADTATAAHLVTAAHEMGYPAVDDCRLGRLYFVRGDLTAADIDHIARSLLADPVTEQYRVHVWPTADDDLVSPPQIDVTLLPGVTDPAAENLIRTAAKLGHTVERAATGQTYRLSGDDLDHDTLGELAENVFSNPVVQQTAVNRPIKPPFFAHQESDHLVETIPLTEADDDHLERISRERRLSMNLTEMQAIRAYYQKEEREPTDIELEMLAQTWSEHCVHKTFRAKIEYTGPDGRTETVDGILKQFLRAATDRVNKPWVRSAFVDNAGIVAFTPEYSLAFKVETHNHPSALEPFGGANTGIGGVVRDVLGVSARPIANTDVLCFGPQEMAPDDLPEGVLHPRRIQAGVIDGIEDYGNKMGIPTVNGTILYDAGYVANPLVYCGCLGILPVDSHVTEPQPGDLVVALGGRTGRDGLRGATFSSMEMDTSTSEIAGTAVQIGHPIMEKQVQEVILQARDQQLYTAITDCGAGGFSSAVGEMSETLGARVQLQNIPLKYPGLRPWEIWLSEAQERMVLAVSPEKMARLEAICAGQDVEATVLGEFTGSGRLEIYYGDRLVGQLDEAFLHDGIPQHELTAEWRPPALPDNLPPAPPKPPAWALRRLLRHPNIRSKEDTIRKYDHEVQAGTAVKPLIGVMNHGPSDAAVLVPLDTQHINEDGPQKAAALSNGICPQFTAVDPYNMAWAAIDEAIRNAVAVGADPDQLSILDNFCWGNPNLPDRLGALVRCAQGCYDAAVAYGTPYISGKDSLYNEYTGADGEKHAIPGTLLISALGIVPDVARTTTADFKTAGDHVYQVGVTKNEMAGSHYADLMNTHPALGRPPAPVENGLGVFRTLHTAIRDGICSAVHDCSEGGLAVAVAEMALSGRIGATLDLSRVPADTADLGDVPRLFAESLTRFVVTVPDEQRAVFEEIMRKGEIPCGRLGHTGGTDLIISGVDGETVIDIPVSELDGEFRGHIDISQPIADHPPTAVSDEAISVPAVHTHPPKVLILHANGTNRDRDAAVACRLAGGEPEIVHVNQLIGGERDLLDYHMLLIPGGFSYGDDLGAGVIWGTDLQHLLTDPVRRFVADGRPVLGICNGFQVLVKAGLLTPDLDRRGEKRPITLTYNQSDRFECRWVYLQPDADSPSVFTQGMHAPIYVPVAHGEGRFATADAATTDHLRDNHLIPLRYTAVDGADYPFNPNGSVHDIAAVCNAQGNVMGLMPHPEDHIRPWQHPRAHRGERGGLGLQLFINGINHSRR